MIHSSDEILGMESIGARLARVRAEAGLTQGKLASASGVSQGTIGNIEAGIRGYGKSVVRVAAALRVSTDYLECKTNERGDIGGERAPTDGAAPISMAAVRSRPSVSAALEVLGEAIEAAEGNDRADVVKMLEIFVGNPRGNVGLVPLIAGRLSGGLVDSETPSTPREQAA